MIVKIKKNENENAENYWKLYCPFCENVSYSEYEIMGTGDYNFYFKNNENSTYYQCQDGGHEFFIDYKDLENQTEETLSIKNKKIDGWFEIPILKITEIVDAKIVGYSSDVKINNETMMLVLNDVNIIHYNFYDKPRQTIEENINLLKKFDYFKYFKNEIHNKLNDEEIKNIVLKSKYDINSPQEYYDGDMDDIYFNISKSVDIYSIKESGLNVDHDGVYVLCKLENGDRICLSGD